jgi:hypothetical protein
MTAPRADTLGRTLTAPAPSHPPTPSALQVRHHPRPSSGSRSPKVTDPRAWPSPALPGPANARRSAEPPLRFATQYSCAATNELSSPRPVSLDRAPAPHWSLDRHQVPPPSRVLALGHLWNIWGAWKAIGVFQ